MRRTNPSISGWRTNQTCVERIRTSARGIIVIVMYTGKRSWLLQYSKYIDTHMFSFVFLSHTCFFFVFLLFFYHYIFTIVTQEYMVNTVPGSLCTHWVVNSSTRMINTCLVYTFWFIVNSWYSTIKVIPYLNLDYCDYTIANVLMILDHGWMCYA